MPNITIVLSENTDRRLRKVVKERHGSKKGALSELIDEAVKDLLDRLEQPRAFGTFRAIKDGKVIAEAATLEHLASKLRNAGVEPRAVRIISSKPLSSVVRAGFRARLLE